MAEQHEFDAVGFGVAFGAVYGVLLLLIGWAAWLTGYGVAYVSIASSIMPGFGASLTGGVIGGVAGAVLGFAMGWGIAAVYNWTLDAL